jgi:putative tape measure domain protein
MASISTTITAVDRMSGPLRQIYQNARILRNELETIGRLSSLNNVGASMNNLTRNVVNNVNIINLQLNQVNNNIRDAFNSSVVNNFNQQVREGQSAVGGFEGKIRSLVGAYIGLRGIQKIVGLSDAMASSSAKLSVLVDDNGSVENLERKIFASAQRSRANYITTMGTVAKLANNAGEAFANGDETIQFAENLNKLFVINGATQAEVASASLQLTQALGSGVLRGEELNAVFEAAPAVIRTIADYLNVPIGQIRALAKEGKITAGIVKSALLGATDQINSRFNAMPVTWGQVWTNIVNRFIEVSRPLLQFISMLAQNWATLEPVVLAVIAAVGFYIVTTKLATLATYILFNLLTLNPIMWVAMIIGILVYMIYKWIQSVGGVRVAWAIAMDVMLTAFDDFKISFLTGVFAVMNGFMLLSLKIEEVRVGILNSLGDMKAGGLMIIQNFVNGAIYYINELIKQVNNIPGVAIPLIKQVSFGTQVAIENEAAKAGRNGALEEIRNNIDENIKNRDVYLQALKTEANAKHELRLTQTAKLMSENDGGLKLNGLGMGATLPADVGKIKDNTGAMHDKLSKSEEDLKYLRDIAARDAINRFTTAEIKIEQHNNNNINSDMDLDGVVDYLVTTTAEAVNSVAEGVHI